MIDFRYHLVSLISVFLALAVGIALGAGPLEEAIGDTLTGQVDQLRQEKDDLRAELDATLADRAATEAFVTAAAPQLQAGTLDGRRVAVVALGELDEDTRAALDAQLTAAGATLTGHVTLAPAWTDPALASFRQALVGNLVGYLDPVPAADATSEVALAEALAQALGTPDPANPDALAESGSLILQVMTAGDTPLLTVTDAVTTAADAIVVVAAGVVPATAEAETEPPSDEIAAAWLAVVVAAQQRTEGAVLLDGPRVDGGLVARVLGDESWAAQVATVSDGHRVTGRVTLPLALNVVIGGTVGHYGAGADLTPLPTPVLLAPVDRTAQGFGTGDGEGAADGATEEPTDGTTP